MRKLKVFLVVLVILGCIVPRIGAEEIPTPPYYGMWVLRDGDLIKIPAFICTQVGDYRGVPPELDEKAFKLRATDRIFYFINGAIGRMFATPLNTGILETGGNPWAGGTYEVGLFLPETDEKNKIINLGINMRPAKYINGIIMQEIILDLTTVWSRTIVLHGGVLTFKSIVPYNEPVFLLLYNRTPKRDLRDLFKKLNN